MDQRMQPGQKHGATAGGSSGKLKDGMSKPIWLDSRVLCSPAFRTLSKWSILVYLDFLARRQMETKKSNEWVIRNNGELVYPYAEAEKRGIARREFRNAIDELMEKGFLDITHHGNGGHAGDTTKYLLAERWKAYGTASFCPPETPRLKDTRQGRGWNAYHAKQNAGNKSATEKGEME